MDQRPSLLGTKFSFCDFTSIMVSLALTHLIENTVNRNQNSWTTGLGSWQKNLEIQQKNMETQHWGKFLAFIIILLQAQPSMF